MAAIIKLAEAFTELTVRDTAFRAGLTRAQKALAGFRAGLSATAGFASRTLVIGALAAAGPIAKAIEQAEALTRLKAALDVAGRGGEETAKKFEKLAGEISATVGVSKAEVLAVEGIIAQFQRIPTDQIEAATKAVFGLAGRSGDAEAVARKLGSAMSSAGKAIGFLEAAGVNLTLAQKAELNALRGTTNFARVQAVVLRMLGEHYDAVTANTETWVLQLRRAMNTVTELGARIASVVAPVLGDYAAIIGGAADATQALPGPIRATGAAMARLAVHFLVGAFVLDKFVKSAVLLKPLLGVFTAFAALRPFATSPKDLAVAIGQMTGLTKIVSGIATAFAAISAPVLIAVGAIAALVAVFTLLWKTSSVFRDTVTDLWDQLKEAVQPILDVLGQLAASFGKLFGRVLKVIGSVLIIPLKVVGALLGLLLKLLQPIIDAFASAFEAVADFMQPIVDAFTWLVDRFTEFIDTFSWDKLPGGAREAADAIGRFFTRAWGIIRIGFAKLLDFLTAGLFDFEGRLLKRMDEEEKARAALEKPVESTVLEAPLPAAPPVPAFGSGLGFTTGAAPFLPAVTPAAMGPALARDLIPAQPAGPGFPAGAAALPVAEPVGAAAAGAAPLGQPADDLDMLVRMLGPAGVLARLLDQIARNTGGAMPAVAG